MDTLTAKGSLGTVSFDGVYVTISRTGLQAVGGGKGERRLPVGTITTVQWKPPSMLMRGFIEFGTAGRPVDTRKGGSAAKAAQNQNAVFFTKKQMPAFADIRDAVESAINEASRRPPPAVSQRGRNLATVDVTGTRDRAVSGTHHFEDTLDELPTGPLKVTLQLKPNDANPYAIAAFVGSQQVGWLQHDWSADDPHVMWMHRLKTGGLRPRFFGECEQRAAGKYIIFYTPRKDELTAVANDLLVS